MISFLQFLAEMPTRLMSYDKESHRLQDDGFPSLSPRAKYGKVITQTATHNIHRTYHGNTDTVGRSPYDGPDIKGITGKVVSYTAVHKETGEAHMRVMGIRKGKNFIVSSLKGKEGSTIKAHDFYHHLTVRHGISVHSDDAQSVGAQKVWQKFLNKPNVKAKHYEPNTNRELPIDHKNFDQNYAGLHMPHGYKSPQKTSRFKVSPVHKWYHDLKGKKLDEGERNPERAKQLLDRIGRMKKFKAKPYPSARAPGPAVSLIKHGGDEANWETADKYRDAPKRFVPTVQDVPHNKMRTIQRATAIQGIKDKLDGKFPSKDLPQIVHHNGTYYVFNGNHTIAKDRLLGKKSSKADVYDYKKVNEQWKVDSHTSYYRKERHITAKHDTQVGKHRVSIGFLTGDPNRKMFHVDYEVDGKYNRQDGVDPKDGRKIIHHVGRKIDSFIRHMKPAELSMDGNTDKKQALYNKFMQHIAKKHGGRVQGKSVFFDRNEPHK